MKSSTKVIITVLIIAVILSLLILWFFVLERPALKNIELEDLRKISEKSKCGNKVCELAEDCNTCSQDCGCKADEVCRSSGVCQAKEMCGDDICSDKERSEQLCCDDCGCPSGKICNENTQECQAEVPVSKDVRAVAEEYMTEKSIHGRIIEISDEYYKDQIVNQVRIDCRTPDYPEGFVCEVVLFIDNKGVVLEEIRMV